MRRKFAIAIVAFCFSFAAFAEESDSNCRLSGIGSETTEECISKSDLLGGLDLAAPSNSLFSLMGSTPETVITPKTGDDIMVSYLPEIVDALGNENTSLAIEVNPGLLMMPEYISPQDLNLQSGARKDDAVFGNSLSMAKHLSRFSFSLAHQQKKGTHRSSQTGLGITFVHDSRLPFFSAADQRKCMAPFSEKVLQAADEIRRFGSIIDSLVGASSSNPALRDFPQSELSKLKSALIPKADGNKGFKIPDYEAVLKAFEYTIEDQAGNRVETKFSEAAINEMVGKLDTHIQSLNLKSITRFRRAAKDCASFVTRWNRDVYGVGAAVLHTDVNKSNSTGGMPETTVDDETGIAIWASAALESPWGKKSRQSMNFEGQKSSDGQFIFHARYNDNLIRQREIENETVDESVDLWSVGGRYVHQVSASKDQSKQNSRAVRAFIEAAYTEEKFSNTTDEFWQAGIGAEFQIRKDLFFQFVIGDTFGSEIDRSTYLSGQFKWSFSKVAAE